MDVPVYDINGKQVGTMSIDEQSLGGQVNPDLIKQAYVRYHSNTRQGSARTLSRSEVSYSRRKMYKQKGTGRARHGDRKVNLMRHGGHWKSRRQTREDFRPDMPRKMRRKANRNALLAKLIDNEVKIVDSLAFDTPKTKVFLGLIGALGIDHRVLVAMGDDAETRNARLSARNVADVTLCRTDQLTAFNMLNHRYLIVPKAELEAWLSGPSSQTDKQAKINPMGRKPASDAAKG